MSCVLVGLDWRCGLQLLCGMVSWFEDCACQVLSSEGLASLILLLLSRSRSANADARRQKRGNNKAEQAQNEEHRTHSAWQRLFIHCDHRRVSAQHSRANSDLRPEARGEIHSRPSTTGSSSAQGRLTLARSQAESGPSTVQPTAASTSAASSARPGICCTAIDFCLSICASI